MKKLFLILAVVFLFAACKSKDTTEDNNLEGQQTELGIDNSDAEGTSGMDNTATNDSASGPSSYNAGTSYPGDTANNPGLIILQKF